MRERERERKTRAWWRRRAVEKREEEGHAEDGDRKSPSSKTHPVAFQSLRAVLLLLLEAAAALALVKYVRCKLPALGAGAADAARRATRHRDTCELTAIRAKMQHRLPPFGPVCSFPRLRYHTAPISLFLLRFFQEVYSRASVTLRVSLSVFAEL